MGKRTLCNGNPRDGQGPRWTRPAMDHARDGPGPRWTRPAMDQARDIPGPRWTRPVMDQARDGSGSRWSRPSMDQSRDGSGPLQTRPAMDQSRTDQARDGPARDGPGSLRTGPRRIWHPQPAAVAAVAAAAARHATVRPRRPLTLSVIIPIPFVLTSPALRNQRPASRVPEPPRDSGAQCIAAPQGSLLSVTTRPAAPLSTAFPSLETPGHAPGLVSPYPW